MWLLQWVGFKDPDIFRYAFSSESIPPNGANRGNYVNNELDQLLEQGKSELDEEKEKKYTLKFKLFLKKMYLIYSCFTITFMLLLGKNIKNYQPYADLVGLDHSLTLLRAILKGSLAFLFLSQIAFSHNSKKIRIAGLGTIFSFSLDEKNKLSKF